MGGRWGRHVGGRVDFMDLGGPAFWGVRVTDFLNTDIFEHCPVKKKLDFLFICWLKFDGFFNSNIHIINLKI